jgi:hypothetical protein
MATIDLGKIKQVFRGTYNNATAYAVDDLVVFTDTNITSTYICTTASTGNNPSSGGTAHANWAYIAKGVTDPIPSQSGNSGKFLTTNGSALSFGNAGITQVDKWNVTSNFTGTVDPVSSNLARFTTGGSYVGGGMSVSSGVFTFPSTGFYKIDFSAQNTRVEGGRQSRYQAIEILKTTNNSSYTTLAQGHSSYYDNYNAAYRYCGNYCSAIFDVTDTSTHKVRFKTEVQDNDSQGVRWDSPHVQMTFFKLADT